MISTRSFSSKLSFSILLLAIPIFVLALGVLFYQSRRIIREEAVGHANGVLDATMQRVCLQLQTIETATDVNSWLIQTYLQPDSLQHISHRVVSLNPHVDGCSISTEPEVFPEYGRYFSTYTVREGDSITSVIEKQYEYFTKIWYRLPRELGKPCWVDFYDEADSLELTLDGMIASYCKPIYDTDGRFVAVISSDLSLIRLSKIITAYRPYPNSYFMMIDKEGRYFIHPDPTRLFNQTIFDGANPRRQADVIALGHEMVAGNKGSMAAVIEGKSCLVCYQPISDTGWSLAVVCPDSDVLYAYHRLTYVVLSLLIFGLFIIILLCNRVAAHAIRPLNQLLEKTQCITSGNMDVNIPRSKRTDAVGRLQNSFSTMLDALKYHIGSVNQTAEQARRRNEELKEVTQLAEKSNRQKDEFIRNVTHQIRTPLNIIIGFAQVLRDTSDTPLLHSHASDEEIKSITETMNYNAKLLSRIVMMLFDSSDTGLTEEMHSHKQDMVSCNQVAKEAIGFNNMYNPHIKINFHTEVDDSFCIQTNHLYLMRSLREIIYNSSKYSDRENISIFVKRLDHKVRFIVQDTGKGIDASERERMFKFFTKIDDLSEGLGLGLPLSKRHAQNLGGDLILDESYHDGCRFIVEIPF
ncbi:MAG: histidine kinase [Bacteroidaceae bacterium]|nr:histidine kinase [Bacteroidaceae bacterium]